MTARSRRPVDRPPACGIPAVLAIEGADNTNGNIPSARDTLEHVDAGFAAEILRMVVGFVAQSLG